MAYRALKPLLVGDVQKAPGDLVPEAMDWTNLQVWIATGYIEEIPEPPANKPAAAKRATVKRAAAKKPTAKKPTATKKTAKE